MLSPVKTQYNPATTIHSKMKYIIKQKVIGVAAKNNRANNKRFIIFIITPLLPLTA